MSEVGNVGAISGGVYNKVKGLCFAARTLVLTAIGYVLIEDASIGDKVWSENPETGEKGLKKVVQTFVNETDELVHVHVNGEEIITTPGHQFYAPQNNYQRNLYPNTYDRDSNQANAFKHAMWNAVMTDMIGKKSKTIR